MKYRKVEISSENSSDSDEEQVFHDEKKNHREVKRIIKTLKHPSDSQEFMEHLLSQTMKVDNLRGIVKKMSCFLGFVALVLFFYNLIGYWSSHMLHLQLQNMSESITQDV